TTACGPMTEPAPTRTCAPTSANAPTSTSPASSAPASTTAVGCTRAIASVQVALRHVAHRGQQYRFADDGVADARFGAEAPDASDRAHEVDLHQQTVAGHHLALEARRIDAGEQHELAAVA